MENKPMAAEVAESRIRVARLLAEIHRLHLSLAQESRALKKFTTAGHNLAEIEIGGELLEQYLGASDAFLENMRGRFENRLGLLRRCEPRTGPEPELSPGHGNFWLSFSRLCVVLRRTEKATGR